MEFQKPCSGSTMADITIQDVGWVGGVAEAVHAVDGGRDPGDEDRSSKEQRDLCVCPLHFIDAAYAAGEEAKPVTGMCLVIMSGDCDGVVLAPLSIFWTGVCSW